MGNREVGKREREKGGGKCLFAHLLACFRSFFRSLFLLFFSFVRPDDWMNGWMAQ